VIVALFNGAAAFVVGLALALDGPPVSGSLLGDVLSLLGFALFGAGLTYGLLRFARLLSWR
jgi:hypothetical protein